MQNGDRGGPGGGGRVIVSLKVNFKGNSRAVDYIAIGIELSMVNIYNKYSHYNIIDQPVKTFL